MNTSDTASATAFLLPLILGLSSIGFIFSAIIALSPTAAEIVEEDELMKRIGQSQAARQAQAAPSQAGPVPAAAAAAARRTSRTRRRRTSPGRRARQPVPPAPSQRSARSTQASQR